jgi:hypothetical protein
LIACITMRGCMSLIQKYSDAVVAQARQRAHGQRLGLFARQLGGGFLRMGPAHHATGNLDDLPRGFPALLHDLVDLALDQQAHQRQQRQHDSQRDHHRLGGEVHAPHPAYAQAPETQLLGGAGPGKGGAGLPQRLRRAHGVGSSGANDDAPRS